MRVLKVFLILFLIAAVLWLLMFVFSRKTFPVQYGISFNQNHATSLDLDWKEVYTAMLSDLQPTFIRIAAMWSEVEPVSGGEYDFADVDWMMDQAAAHNAKVVLVVGQKAPRWPECHVPEWVKGYEQVEAKEHLSAYVTAVVERYKNHEALEFWQVENEAFIEFEFGDCEGYRRDLVDDEVQLVRELDPGRKIVMTDSGELSTWYKPSKLGDILGTTLYRVVRTPKGKIFSYDWLPAGHYRLKAKLMGKSPEEFFVAELQAEPWFDDSTPLDTPVDVQEETMNPERLIKHLDYAQRVGASRVYLWGVEWWYYMKEQRDDTRYWDLIQEQIVVTPEE